MSSRTRNILIVAAVILAAALLHFVSRPGPPATFSKELPRPVETGGARLPSQDLDELVAALLPLARETLAKQGELYPFAVTMTADGKVHPVVASGAPDSTGEGDLVTQLLAAMRVAAERGEIRASGLCLNARIGLPDGSPDTDAILVRLDHRDSEPVDAYLPYSREAGSQIKFGELATAAGTPAVFGHRGNDAP